MTARRPLLSLVAGLFAAPLALWLPRAASAFEEVAISAVSMGNGLVVIAARLANTGDVPLEEVSVVMKLPRGAALEAVLGAPAASTPRPTGRAIAWTFDRAPARSIVGPFAVAALMEEEGARTKVLARWRGPKRSKAKAKLAGVEDASAAGAALPMAQRDLDDLRASFFRYQLGDGPAYAARLGSFTGPGEALFTPLPGTGMRFWVPHGDLGETIVVRLPSEPPDALPDELDFAGSVFVQKAAAGPLLLEVPLVRPLPPYTLLRVFADHGAGFLEQQSLGTVAADGLHGTFAADGASRYVLGFGPAEAASGVVSLGPAALARETFPVDSGAQSIFQDGYSDVFTFTQMIAGFRALLISQTEAAGGGQPTGEEPSRSGQQDYDGDGLSNGAEMRLGTNPEDPDSDADGLGDGVEVTVTQTDPENPDEDGDGCLDSCESDNGTDPRDEDSDEDGANDGDEIDAGTDPNDPNDKPDSFAPVPGCGGWGTCFSFEGLAELFYVTDVVTSEGLAGILRAPESTRGLLPRGSPPQGGVQEAGDLRWVVGTIGDAVFTCIPAGQRVKIDLRRPYMKYE